MSDLNRSRCATCGHGYGVHDKVRQPLRIIAGKVEFYECAGAAPEACTGYPDMMERDGKRCPCRQFVRPAAATGVTE